MAQDVQFVILVSLLLGHKKCDEWPYSFATIGGFITLGRREGVPEVPPNIEITAFSFVFN